ncbi:MAG: CtsR family transcriptional regulator, partial [Clostridia bacterium]|nr:CtsR family transcriptional regulator [Clostridia bacterium]
VSNLLGYNKITEREAKIILASLSDNILPFPAPIKNEIRSAAMKNILINLI